MSYLQDLNLELERKIENNNVLLDFCDKTSQYFTQNKDADNYSGYTLIEGFFMEAGPNYAIRIGTIANNLANITKTKSIAYLNNSKYEPIKKEMLSSFGVNNIIGLNNEIYPYINNFIYKVNTCIYFFIGYILILFNFYSLFRKLSFKGVTFGDLLYDDYIKREASKCRSLKYIKIKDIAYFKEAVKTILTYKYISNKYNIKYYVTTHSQYLWGGIPVRYFHKLGIPIFETTDDMLFIFDKSYKLIPKYHDYIKEKIYKYIKLNNNISTESTRQKLENRFSGKIEQLDVKLAFKDKKIYSLTDLKEKLNINNDFPFVFIFAHIFSDAPCGLSNFQLFPDYYLWLKNTIKYCSKVINVNWIIKEHPSVNAYNEKGAVKEIVNKYKVKNLYICPDDFSTASLTNTAHSIITAQGTVGIEFSCIGIPVIVTAKPFYSGFDFTYEPRNIKQYKKLLRNIASLKPLNSKQINTALIVYETFQSLQNNDFSLIDTKIKNMTWGCDVPVDIYGAYKLMTKRLEHINPNEMYFVKQINEYFKNILQ